MKLPERDYSHRTLVDKLAVKPGARVALAGASQHDAWFVDMLDAFLEAPPARSVRGTYDAIFLRVNAPADLAKIATLASKLAPAGALWVIHPKGKGANPHDSQVRAAGLAAGLVDNKISAYSETHTATRYVIPLNKRQ